MKLKLLISLVAILFVTGLYLLYLNLQKPASSLKTYSNSELNFSFQYPDNWSAPVEAPITSNSGSLYREIKFGSNLEIDVHGEGDNSPFTLSEIKLQNQTQVLSSPKFAAILSSDTLYVSPSLTSLKIVMFKISPTNLDDIKTILKSFEFISNTTSKITFSNGNSVAFNKAISNSSGYTTDTRKLSDDEYAISTQFELKYYSNLPKALTNNVYTNSNGNDAASGYYYDFSPTTINRNKFSRGIYYYNPIGLTKSGKYDSSISSPMSTSCIYTFSDKSGFVVFSPLVPNAGADACDFVNYLTDLIFINK